MITKIILQQMVAMDQTSITASRYPRYTVVLGNSISSITAGELTASVDAAAASAAAAQAAALDSQNSAQDSSQSAQDADISAQASEASAKASATSATSASNFAQNAETSAGAALTSKNAAAASATTASTSAQNAATSKQLADEARIAAEAAKTAAELAETNAETAETNASGFADDAAASAAAAKISETNSKTSETNAAGSATTAGTEAGNATTEADRAKAEADRASQVVDGKLDKQDISTFIKAYKTVAEATADLPNRVLNEKILVWNKTDAKYGWYKVGGTEQAPTLDLESEESKLITVNNVQPDDNGNVQVTIPGGNPSLWLGEVTWFPYDSNSGIGYSGVLPADGREVNRVDYPDTWEAIDAGLIPSVTDAQWQAGQKMYFSKGNGTTTFRLPDMMQGQAFRAPTKGETDAGVIKTQIPYVLTVNGEAPDDNGAVTIAGSDLSGTVPVTKGGTGATTDTAARTNLKVDRLVQGVTGTGLNSANGNVSLTVTNTGWYVYDSIAKKNVPLALNMGGTGATDIAGARTNLNINRLAQNTGGTSLYSPDGNVELNVNNTGWFFYNTTTKSNIPASVNMGGTGAVDARNARTNLGVNRLDQSSSTQTAVFAGAGRYALIVNDGGSWGCYDTQGSGAQVPLNIGYGGTGGLFETTGVSSSLYNATKVLRFSIGEVGWAVYKSSTNEVVPLSINAGGTNATTAAVARTNLGLGEGNGVKFTNLTVGADDTNIISYPGVTLVSSGKTEAQIGRRIQLESANGGNLNILFRDGSTSTNQVAFSLFNTIPAAGGYQLYGTHNTTKAADGTLKAASPIVKIFADGTSETNGESEGAVVTRQGVGEYLITNVLGMNSDASWGGIDGGFDLPKDRNGQILVWLDYKVLEDGSVLVKTFHRTYPTSPLYAQNSIEGVSEGDPIDIPKDQYVSVRVEMPEDSIYNTNRRLEDEKAQDETPPSPGEEPPYTTDSRQDSEIDALKVELEQLKELVRGMIASTTPENIPAKEENE